MKNKFILNLILVAVVILSAIPAGALAPSENNSKSFADNPATFVDSSNTVVVYDDSYKTEYTQVSDYSKTAATGNIIKENGVVTGIEYKTIIGVKPAMSNGLYTNCSITLSDGVYSAGNNLFSLSVDGTSVIVSKNGETLSWNPQLFISNEEIKLVSGSKLLSEDPMDKTYHDNTLEWDYGVCVRHLRIIEGTVQDCWIFSKDPGDSVQIRENSVASKGFIWQVAPFAYDANYDMIPITDDKFVKAEDMRSAKYPVVIDPTTNYDVTTDGGYIYNVNANYNTAWTSSTGSGATIIEAVGQRLSSGNYTVYRGFNFYETEVIPDDAIISSANVSLVGSTDYSTTDFVIQVTNGQPTYPHDPLVAGDYDKSNYSGLGSDSGFSTSDWASVMNISLNSTGISWINKTGTTKLCLRSDREIAGTTPGGLEYVSLNAWSGYLEVTYTFLTSTVTYTSIGTVNFTVPARVTSVKVLIVAGGGGGGGSYSGVGKTWWSGGGGGGGGVVYNTTYAVTAGTNVSVTVGDGGTGGTAGSVTAKGTNGSDSKFGTLTAIGGGAGGGAGSTPSQTTRNGNNGGCGGGEGVQDSSTSAGGTGSQGYNGGGSYYEYGAAKGAGGGGGGGSDGGTAVSSTGGNGGTGYSSSITGPSVVYAGGGGGSGAVGGGAGSGGGGVGGSSANGNPGTDGYGGGGGGGGGTWLTSRDGADGGSGVVIIQYTQYPEAPTNVAATDGTYTNTVVITWTKSTGATGYYVYNGSTVIATLGDVATYNDSAAAAPTITAGTANASDGTFTAYVTLIVEGEAGVNGSSRTYKVVAFNGGGNSSDSSTNAGYRGTTTLTYQWWRSAADSDASYSSLSGATTDPYNDTTAASNGSAKYYKCNISMTDAVTVTSAANRGYRNVVLSISNTPASKAFSYVLESSSYWSNGSAPSFPLTDAQCFFTVTNDGSSAETISINGTAFTGGVGWTLTSGSPGSNTVRLKSGKSGDANEGVMITINSSPQSFISALAVSGTKKWEIKLETGTFTDGVLKTGTVILTAVTD